MPHTPGPAPHDFERRAEARSRSVTLEFWDYMRTHKKWWISPILIVLLLLGILIVLGSTGAAPFIYTLF
jgi:hypothetical protein